MPKTDIQLKQDIEAELACDPKVNAAQIGVAVNDGAVSLFGSVDTYAERWAAEDATKRVNGVRTVAEDLTVKLLADHQRDDSDIAAMVQRVLTWNVLVPKTVTAVVRNGAITLAGEVDWNHEREASDRAIRYLTGVAEVHNAITLKAHPAQREVKAKVQAALERQAPNPTSIRIESSGSKVTLTGHASSWQSMQNAVNAAWAVPGVAEVIDQVELEVTH